MADRLDVESRVDLIEDAKAVLASYGVVDWKTCMAVPVTEFIGRNYGDFGKGTAFLNTVLGRLMGFVTRPAIMDMAKKLGFEEPIRTHKTVYDIVDQFATQIKTELEGICGIDDAFVFEEIVLPELRQVIKDAVLVHESPGLGLVHPQNIDELCETLDEGMKAKATLLSVEQFSEVYKRIADLRQEARKNIVDIFKEAILEQLARYGIFDRKTLCATSTHDFIDNDYGPFGKGTLFASFILGRTVAVRRPILDEIADVVGFEAQQEEELNPKERAIKALNQNGIVDRKTLLAVSPSKFAGMGFEGCGKGFAFAGAVLGRKIAAITVPVLVEIADALGFAVLDEVKEDFKTVALRALAEHGITDMDSLIAVNAHDFEDLQFGEIGKGRFFLKKLLGATAQVRADKPNRRKAGEILGLKLKVASVLEKV